MRKQILSAVLFFAVLAFAACQNSEAVDPIDSFSAFSEASTSAKTHLEPDVANCAFRVLWDENDWIRVYDAYGASAIYIAQQGDVEAATFTGFAGTGVASGSTYTAFYPATMDASYNSGSSRVTLPVQQTYQAVQQDSDGGYYGYVTGFPMAAQSTSTNLYFKNLCGLCVLRLKGPSGAVVSSITLSEPTYPYTTATALSGSFNVGWSSGLPTLRKSATTAGQDSVRLSGCNITLDDNYHLFYFYLPEGDHKWLNVKVYYSYNGTAKSVCRTILATSYGANNISFDRSRWTALDVDLSTEMNNTEIPISQMFSGSPNEGQGLIYAANNLDFAPELLIYDSDIPNVPILNTNQRITNVAQSYTILIDATPIVLDNSEVGNIPRYYTLYSDMDATSPNNGITIRYRKAHGEPLAINVEGPHASEADKLVLPNGGSDNGFTVAAGTRNRIVLIVGESSYQLYANSSSDGSNWSERQSVSGSITQDNWLTNDGSGYVRAVVGGDQSDVDGADTEVNQLKHNFQGTIHSIRIYNRVIFIRELSNWLSYGTTAPPAPIIHL